MPQLRRKRKAAQEQPLLKHFVQAGPKTSICVHRNPDDQRDTHNSLRNLGRNPREQTSILPISDLQHAHRDGSTGPSQLCRARYVRRQLHRRVSAQIAHHSKAATNREVDRDCTARHHLEGSHRFQPRPDRGFLRPDGSGLGRNRNISPRWHEPFSVQFIRRGGYTFGYTGLISAISGIQPATRSAIMSVQLCSGCSHRGSAAEFTMPGMRQSPAHLAAVRSQRPVSSAAVIQRGCRHQLAANVCCLKR